MEKLYQRLFGWTRSFASRSSPSGVARTVHTKVTVERQGVTLLTGSGLLVNGVYTCPFCGQALHSSQSAHAQILLEQSLLSQEGLVERVLEEDATQGKLKGQPNKVPDHKIDVGGDQPPPRQREG